MPSPSPLRRWVGRLAWALAVSLAVGLIVRLAWSVTTTRTGGPFVASFWRSAIQATFGWPAGPFGEREPRDQADYWLARFQSLSTSDAEALCGAAWVLDLPRSGYEKHKMRLAASPMGTGFSKFELNKESLTMAEAEFELRVQSRREELIRKAAAIDPTDPEPWRAYALLAFSAEGWATPFWMPRTDRWREILNECRTHDPENALYDAIAAVQDLRMSSSLVFDGDPYTLEIHDRVLFAEGLRSLERAVRLPSLRFGTEQTSSVWRLLESIGESPVDREETVGGAQVHNRVIYFMRDLGRFQQALSGNAEREGNLEEAKSILIRALRFPERLAGRDGNTADTAAHASIFSSVLVASLLMLEEREPGTLSLEEYDRFTRQQMELRQEEDRRKSVVSALPKPPRGWASPSLTAAFVLVNPAFAVLTLLAAVGLGLLAVALRSWRGGAVVPAASWLQILVAWSVGWGLSFLVAVEWAARLGARHVPSAVVADSLFQEATTRMGPVVAGAFVWAGKSFERVATLAALLISTAWTAAHWRCLPVARGDAAPTAGGLLFACARDGCRLMLVMAALLLIVHLLVLPTMVDFTEAKYRYWARWMSEPGTDWRMFESVAPPNPTPAG